MYLRRHLQILNIILKTIGKEPFCKDVYKPPQDGWLFISSRPKGKKIFFAGQDNYITMARGKD